MKGRILRNTQLFACFIFMLVNAFFVALSHLYVRWENKRYERSRWMFVEMMTESEGKQ
ncbi:MAG: hypothetical protein SPF20_08390 [Prevotella sp.]|nr:hypothetical protein [Prevotella sp.]